LKCHLDTSKNDNVEVGNLAKPLRARLEALFFVVVPLDLRMTRFGEPRLE
jgi:hypothetical protein